MWIVTRAGFFSAVQKLNSRDLTIRARVQEDLVHLLDYLPGPPESYTIEATPQHDYEYRLVCSHEDWAQALSRLGGEINYSNFKGEIGRTDPKRVGILHTVWSALFGLSDRQKPSYVSPYPVAPASNYASNYKYTYPTDYQYPLPKPKFESLTKYEPLWEPADRPKPSRMRDPDPEEWYRRRTQPIRNQDDPFEDESTDAWLDRVGLH
jgi:hypothetical protein